MILCKIQDTLGLQGFAAYASYSYINNKYGLCFQSAGEDTFFTFSFLLHASSFYVSKQTTVSLFQSNQTSAVNNKSYDIIRDARDTFEKLEKYIAKYGQTDRFSRTIFDLKFWVKNLFIDEARKPSPMEWRKTFPELNKKILLQKSVGFKRRIKYLLIITHLYDSLLPLLKSKRRGIK